MCTVDLEEDEEQTETDAEAGEMILGEGHRGCRACIADGKWQGIRLRKGACTNPLCNLQLP